MQPQLDVTVGKKLLTARLEMGYSSAQAAAEIGSTADQIERFEAGTERPEPGQIHLLANLYGKPVSWFFPDLA